MNRVIRGGLALCFGFGLTLAAIAIADHGEPAELPAGTVLGSVDFSRYCNSVYGDTATARLNEPLGAYGWRCWTTTNNIIANKDIDVHDACEVAFGSPVYEQTDNINDPYSWRCIRGPRSD